MSAATDKELELKVVRFAGKAPSHTISASFGPDGGSIGRRDNSDWVLSDPERFISGQHALISFSDNRFYITDTSVNGVFLNDSATPIGNGNLAPLQHGDSLLIGDYQIDVCIRQQASDAIMRPDEFSDPFAGISREIEGSDLGSTFPNAGLVGARTEPPQEFGLESVEPEPPMPGDHEPSRQANGNSPPSEADNVSDLEGVFQQAAPIPEDWDQITDIGANDEKQSVVSEPEIFPQIEPEPPQPPKPRQSAPIAAEPPPPVTPAAGSEIRQESTPSGLSGPPEPDQQSLRAALARGLGIPESRLGDASLPDLLENLGRVTRSSLEGTMAILRARAEMKSEFRMSQTMIKPVENNPLKFSISIDEALPHIINPVADGGYLAPLRAVFEANEDIEAHMLAVMAGMQAALKVVLKRFKPEILEKRLGKSAILRNLPLYKHAKTWDLFTELYSEIAREAEDDFHQLFGETFTQAYEEQIRRLDQLKQSSFDKGSSTPGRQT
ncbi:MAG: type VI secretion system-associated FHA domain protein TagH [Gammaproteobacteria bacterium]|nr:type VI secretion system-associated FHA domain protein TagH [Gammaproteobacteria bacterium]